MIALLEERSHQRMVGFGKFGQLGHSSSKAQNLVQSNGTDASSIPDSLDNPNVKEKICYDDIRLLGEVAEWLKAAPC